jgi:hypothetical protein
MPETLGKILTPGVTGHFEKSGSGTRHSAGINANETRILKMSIRINKPRVEMKSESSPWLAVFWFYLFQTPRSSAAKS